MATPNASWAARGFQPIHGLDHCETYARVVNFTSLLSLLEILTHFDLELHEMDVVTAFLVESQVTMSMWRSQSV